MLVYELSYKDGESIISENCEDWDTQVKRLKQLILSGKKVKVSMEILQDG